jgi:hypothetical protein
MSFHYTGNGAYCYANSTAMLLAAAGAEVAPGIIESLTTVGVGAILFPTPKGPIPYFSGYLPDLGISLALRTLGYEFDYQHGNAEDDPDGKAAYARLRDLLQHGPVAVGPVDLGLLLYMPGHEQLAGGDHFVVVYEATDDEVTIHDPGGYPYVKMSVEDFLPAWRAERTEYGEAYSMWGNLRRVRQPSDEEIFQATDAAIRERLSQPEAEGAFPAGAAAIRQLAEQVRDGVPDYLHGHLVWFALPLGARRAADFARFWQPYDLERAAIKEEQARHFGAAHTAAMRKDSDGLVRALEGVADCEERFAGMTVGTPVPA